MHKTRFILFFVLIALMSGCGYTTRSLLAPEYKTIYVDNFVNKIPVSQEQSDVRMYRGYRPGMETELTMAVIDRFLFDGNLKIGAKEDSSLILKGDIIDFRKEGLRYDANNNIEEYRIVLIVNIALNDAKTGKLLWEERHFSGESTYRTGGSLATTEGTATTNTISDLARRIVERTIEGW